MSQKNIIALTFKLQQSRLLQPLHMGPWAQGPWAQGPCGARGTPTILEILPTPVPTRTWAEISQSWKPLTGIRQFQVGKCFCLLAPFFNRPGGSGSLARASCTLHASFSLNMSQWETTISQIKPNLPVIWFLAMGQGAKCPREGALDPWVQGPMGPNDPEPSATSVILPIRSGSAYNQFECR